MYTIHEMRYFYLGLAILGKHKSTMADEELNQLLREELIRFTATRSRKYNLPERKASFEMTPRYILAELREYGLLETVGKKSTKPKHWKLTEAGWRLFEMLKDPANQLQLREEFAALTVNTFPEFWQFLQALDKDPANHLGTIPYLSPHEFERFSSTETKQAVEHALGLIHNLVQPCLEVDKERCEPLRMALQKALAKTPTNSSVGQRLGAVLRDEIIRFFVQHFSGGVITSRMRYETIRTRGAFLGLVNYFRKGQSGRTLELVYPTAKLAEETPTEVGWRSIVLKCSPAPKYLWLYYPHWEEFSQVFLEALMRTYQGLPRQVGYVEVADVRNQVCFELRLSDHIFNHLLQQANQASRNGTSPVKIYLDSSQSRNLPSPKRAPLELKEGSFNLLRAENK